MRQELNPQRYQGRPIERTDHPHIVKVAGVAGGEPIIDGTRIMVRTIIEQYQLGNSIEEILWDFPRLSSAELHDALAYYHDHRPEMEPLLEQGTYEYWQPILSQKKHEPVKAVSQ